MTGRAIAAAGKRFRKLYRLQQLLFYRHLANFVFIHINKSGGSSVEKALGIPFLHKTARRYRKEMGEKRWRKTFSFTIVRNPWDRVVSHYHFRLLTNQTDLGASPVSFNDWVKLAYGDQDPRYYDKPRMFMPQTDWISDSRGEVIVDFVGKFETLQDDFDEICKQIGRRRKLLPHVKKSDRGNYRDYYSEESQGIIAERFSRDIALFGYRF